MQRFGCKVPVPRFPGFPLDPPLRSRFQCMVAEPAAGGVGDRLERLLGTFSTRMVLDGLELDGYYVHLCHSS